MLSLCGSSDVRVDVDEHGSLRYEYHSLGIVVGTVQLQPGVVRPTVLPLTPIVLGFIINTLFYALLLWLLFFAPFAARRMLRRRRGLCEKCAYPIGVSPVCTECGAAVPRKVEA